MAETEPMNVDERRKYLHKMRIRYWQTTDKKSKGVLLDEMVTVTQLHRKSLLRLMHGDLARKPRRQQRGKVYASDVQQVVKQIAHSLDYPLPSGYSPIWCGSASIWLLMAN
ncbi:MAG TPA: hypothetical protein VKP08_06090 [Anaerolineales bacterium]|nr:hypothetical protein [Anaerolineales bacterium]